MNSYPTAAWARFDPRGVIWSVALFDAARVHLGDEDTVVGDLAEREKRLAVHVMLRTRLVDAGTSIPGK